MAEGVSTQIAVDSALPFDASSERYELAPAGQTVAQTQETLITEGISGLAAQSVERSRAGKKTTGGTLNFHLSPVWAQNWLTRITGASEAANVWTPPDVQAVPAWQLMIDLVQIVVEFTGCQVSKLTLKGSSGGLVDVAVDIMALDQVSPVKAAGSFPTITEPTDPPYIFDEGAITIDSIVSKIFDFELVYDNLLRPEETNSLTPSRLYSAGRLCTFRCRNPLDATHDNLYQTDLSTGVPLILVFAQSRTSYSFQIDAPAFQIPPVTPTVTSKDEIPLELNGTLLRVGNAAEIVFTSDDTP